MKTETNRIEFKQELTKELDLEKIDREALEFFQLPNMENIRTKFIPSFNSPLNNFQQFFSK